MSEDNHMELMADEVLVAMKSYIDTRMNEMIGADRIQKLWLRYEETQKTLSGIESKLAEIASDNAALGVAGARELGEQVKSLQRQASRQGEHPANLENKVQKMAR